MDAINTLKSPPDLADLRAQGPLALFLDFDGTLVGLAPAPDGIAVPDGLAARLEALSGQLRGALALISGRAIIDLEKHLGPLAVARAGSHGADRQAADGSAIGIAPAAFPPELTSALEALSRQSGFRLERKPHGAALHFRENPAAEAAVETIARELSAEHGFALKRGKCVVELVRPGADKGGAVRAFMAQAEFAGARPVFIGDDITDEDGFAACDDLGGFGILVGARMNTKAQFQLAEPASVHEWLGL